jgi:hypothetical protein
MRSLSRTLLLLLTLSATGAPASAGMLTSATWLSRIPVLPATPSVSVPVIASGTSTATFANVSIFLPAFEASTLVTTAQIDVFVRRTLGGTALLTAGASMAGADAGIPGTLSLRVGEHTRLGGVFPGSTIVQIPLSIGAGASHTQIFYLLSSLHYMTVNFYGWTVGTRSFTGLTSRGVPLPDAVGMGSVALTANGGGTLTLVAPTRIQVLGTPGSRNIAGFDTLTLHFVPEPRSFLLLAAAAAAFARAKVGGRG